MTSKKFAHLNWNDLRVFHAFANTDSVNSASRHLGVDNSTVSRRLLALEKSIDTMLIRRTRNGYKLTGDGIQLKSLVQEMTDGVENIQQWLKEKQTTLSGSVSISCCDISLPRLSLLIRHFQAKYPSVKFTIHATARLANMGANGVDLAIRATNHPDDSLVGICLEHFSFALAAPSSATHQDLLPWVGLNDGQQTLPSERWQGLEKLRCHSTLSTDSYLNVAQLIANGNGIGLIPEFIVRGDPLLQRFPTQSPLPEWQLWLLFQPQLRKSPVMRTFCDFLKVNWQVTHSTLNEELSPSPAC
ncbi:LysR family transcriptional regulator [Veronia pacifica]|uniref:HTH lysR-type domain-containing protein n=1 Tax=Veronia pacifica TaxID=1080227 RepID=A0A1C3ES95_9GAMM|nr:LysR family transcriptional regulator [Veronia pacifica]ODA36104.1 hypothetical protein A8L45_00420 [Veronia pacifica]